MARQASMGVGRIGLIARVRDFLQEVRTEVSKVSWPTREEVKASTQVVLLLLAILAGIIYVYDFVFQLIVKVVLLLLG